jgi:starvation-inducible DNA-binding protein
MTNYMGMTTDNRAEMAAAVTTVLADTYALYFKTHAYHWNVTGARFSELHALFETQYNELWMATDEIAERIRALGEKAPSSYAALAEASTLAAKADASRANDMLADLLAGHETVIATIRAALEQAAEMDDEATADILTPRLTVHEKTAWMLRSSME